LPPEELRPPVNADLALKSRTTALLTTAASADAPTLGELIPLLYDELRELARRQLVGERRDHSLNTTALVHDAYLKLVDDTGGDGARAGVLLRRRGQGECVRS
jgi:hypothetical protein